jgi:hypothetical protein
LLLKFALECAILDGPRKADGTEIEWNTSAFVIIDKLNRSLKVSVQGPDYCGSLPIQALIDARKEVDLEVNREN